MQGATDVDNKPKIYIFNIWTTAAVALPVTVMKPMPVISVKNVFTTGKKRLILNLTVQSDRLPVLVVWKSPGRKLCAAETPAVWRSGHLLKV